MFREGTKVTFNDKGEVVNGTLSHNHERTIKVPIDGRSSLALRPLSEVSFHPNGRLASGTLDGYPDTYVRPVGWQQIKNLTDNTGGFVQFKGGTLIELNVKGEVTKGTLKRNTNLLSPLGKINVYEAGEAVEFDDNGAVVMSRK